MEMFALVIAVGTAVGVAYALVWDWNMNKRVDEAHKQIDELGSDVALGVYGQIDNLMRDYADLNHRLSVLEGEYAVLAAQAKFLKAASKPEPKAEVKRGPGRPRKVTK